MSVGQTDLRSTLAAEVAKCRACRFCVDVCPTYQVSSGVEALSSYGRIQIIKHLLAGVLKLDEGITYALYTCLQCRRCENVCKSKGQNIEICEVIHNARTLLAPNYQKGGGRDS